MLTQMRCGQDGVQERAATAGPRRETREQARDGRSSTATGADMFTLPGPVCLDELAMRSQGKWTRRLSPPQTSPHGQLRGCCRRCRGRERLAFFIVVFYCHDAILMPFPTRLFPPLPSNAAAAGGSGRCFVARWLRPLTWQRSRPCFGVKTKNKQK